MDLGTVPLLIHSPPPALGFKLGCSWVARATCWKVGGRGSAWSSLPSPLPLRPEDQPGSWKNRRGWGRGWHNSFWIVLCWGELLPPTPLDHIISELESGVLASLSSLRPVTQCVASIRSLVSRPQVAFSNRDQMPSCPLEGLELLHLAPCQNVRALKARYESCSSRYSYCPSSPALSSIPGGLEKTATAKSQLPAL